jgi:hypothetical protein
MDERMKLYLFLGNEFSRNNIIFGNERCVC